jgi:RimJ/RimL family protein N-acetyltransferase
MRFYIETKRLILRDILPTDDAGILELDSDPEVHRYLGGNPIKTIEEARNAIDYIRGQYERNGIGRWAIIEKATGNFTGWGGIKFVNDETINCLRDFYDIGYRFIKKYWGKGYATEVARASVAYAWNDLKLSKIYSWSDAGNKASHTVLRKAGFRMLEEFDYHGAPHVWFEMERPDALE